MLVHPSQAAFTAVQTAPQAAFVSASVASASLSSLTSLALPSSSPTSLQNASSNDSFPKWEIVALTMIPIHLTGSILATSFTYDKSFGQEGQTLVGGQELELLGQGLKTHIEMTKSLIESLSFSYSSSQLSRITAGSNPKLSPSEFSHNSSPSRNNSTTSS
ncbi:hypothetical protein BY996DRAFT_8423587 [Phakopsora pachyrhizi]|nr:hypothetical protein BY996DRAFT_8423587 [Phakopsora pachyrhizi]